MPTELFLKPAAIACQSAEIFSRKATPLSAVRLGEVGLCIRYKLERDSSAEIMEELVPKVCKHDPAALLSLHDSLKAKELLAWVLGIRPLKINKASNYSATHSIGTVITRSYTYVQLTLPFQHIQDAVRKRELEAAQKAIK